MANNTLWSDDYWLLLIQLYQKKPVGVKSEFSHPVVELGIELHIPPRTIYEQMCALEKRTTPSLQRLWEMYANNPKRLSRDIKRLKQMAGFYEGVQTTPSFERDYRPIDNSSDITPVMLVIILELYFALTPNTMVSETPEVLDMARLLSLKPEEIVRILEIYQTFDPILKRKAAEQSPIVDEAKRIWKRYYSEQPELLHTEADKLKLYFS